MSTTKSERVLSLVLALAGPMTIGPASAQNSFKVSYFANANTAGVPDGTVRIINTGLPYGPICTPGPNSRGIFSGQCSERRFHHNGSEGQGGFSSQEANEPQPRSGNYEK